MLSFLHSPIVRFAGFMKKYLVIPEGVKAGADGRGLGEPSFVYRQVLDFTLGIATPADQVYLAPANAFGGPLAEEVAARLYLEQRGARFRLLYPGFGLPRNQTRPRYIDTLDNARLLRDALGSAGGEFEMICSHHHAPRAAWCFRNAGFRFTAVHRVPYALEAEAVPLRLFYYRHPLLYRLYEYAALAREIAGSAVGLRR